MVGVQCVGITVKGERCKIVVERELQFCHYHKNQGHHQPHYDQSIVKKRSLAKTVPSDGKKKQFVQRDPQKGFVYVYTLQHLAEPVPKKQDWLQVKKLTKNDWRVFNPKKHILIKIGLTTGTVVRRLEQWQNKCKHKLTYIDPHSQLESQSLASLFRKLSLRTLKLRNYDTDAHGFRTDVNLGKIEKAIHMKLWSLYGRGDIVCHGCSADSSRGYGIHVEWFMIERKEMRRVFHMIDEICEEYK